MIKTALSILFGLLSLQLSAQSIAEKDRRIEGDIIVQLRQNIQAADLAAQVAASRNYTSLKVSRQLGRFNNIHLLRFDPEQTGADALLVELRQHPDVINAQFNYRLEERLFPNDPHFGDQWDMEIIDAPKVWDITTGGVNARGDTIVVAILDSGFDVDHEDMEGNAWRNPGEIPGDGVDNDHNNLIDDVFGWDYPNNSGEISIRSHGNSVAGIVGASGNNSLGVTGVNWNIKLMYLVTTATAHVLDAYDYVIEQRGLYNRTNGAEGAYVVATNASFGQSKTFCSDQPIWGAKYDELGAVGVLTGAGTANSSWDVESVGDMPTTCPSDYLIAVLNTNMEDVKHPNSAFGKVSIDLGSPGQESFTVDLFNRYGEFGGNSAAAPHLTGAIALLYSLPCVELAEASITDPSGTALFIREVILNGVDILPGLDNYTATGGRLNVFNSMELIQESCGGTSGPLEIIKVFPNPTRNELNILYETPDFESYHIRIYNTLGQLMHKEFVVPPRFSSKLKPVDVSRLAGGTYFIEVVRDQERAVEKFIKE